MRWVYLAEHAHNLASKWNLPPPEGLSQGNVCAVHWVTWRTRQTQSNDQFNARTVTRRQLWDIPSCRRQVSIENVPVPRYRARLGMYLLP